jgi:aromatic-L-amino-acid/L-tryptophan decarboxylase
MTSASNLDPDDWTAFRATAHDLLDACITHLQNAADHPWQQPPMNVRNGFRLDDAAPAATVEQLSQTMQSAILPYGSGNTHPRFFGWVQGTGLATGLLAEIVAATVNNNCGGREHAAVYVGREVIDWCRRVFQFPQQASGVLVAGTSQATVIALASARQKALGKLARKTGIQSATQLTAYAAAGAHNAIVKALELIGLGSDALRSIPLVDGAMDVAALPQRISEDRASGNIPFCVVATAGSVDLGNYDDLDAVADLCRDENIWMHVDGAFGAWISNAGEPCASLANGIEPADSLAFDFHKWMFVQYDCGGVLIRDGNIFGKPLPPAPITSARRPKVWAAAIPGTATTALIFHTAFAL